MVNYNHKSFVCHWIIYGLLLRDKTNANSIGLMKYNYCISKNILQAYKELGYRTSAQRELGKVYNVKSYGDNTLQMPETNYTVFNSEAISNKDVNPVTILALSYSSLKSDAMTINLFMISNNQLHDVAIRSPPINSFYLNITSHKIYKL